MSLKIRSLLPLLVLVSLASLSACGGQSGNGGTTVAVGLREWSVQPSPASVAAGDVQFDATNTGALSHELVVLKTDLAPDALPMRQGVPKADEEAAGTIIGEIEPDKLPAGTSASVMLPLTPGKYVLLCNVDGHYAAGMRVGFTVR